MFLKPEDAVNLSPEYARMVIQQAELGGFKAHGGKITVAVAQAALDHVAEQAINRNFPWWKGMRPHLTIPSIKGFKVPDGDYSVGLEHETKVADDDSIDNRRKIVNWLRDKPYVCLDSDGAGGRAGAKVMLEATFNPILLSKLDENWDGCQYVKFLGDNKLVMPVTSKTPGIGIHVNMAKGSPSANWHRYSGFHFNKPALNEKYFGRNYGASISTQGNGTTKWLEFRMFNTTTCPVQLRWFVEASRIMIDLLDARKDNDVNLYAELEKGYDAFYNKVNVKEAKVPRRKLYG